MQYGILFVFIPLLSALSLCAADGPGEDAGGDRDYADLNQLTLVGSETLDRSLDSLPQDDSVLMAEHDDRDGEDLSAVKAERDDLRAQLAQKNKEYTAQYRMAKKLEVLFQQEQQKNGQLQRLLQNALRKLRTFQHDFDSLSRVRSVLDSAMYTAVDTEASLSLDPGSDASVDAASEDITEVASPPKQQPTGLTTTAPHAHSSADQKKLGPGVKPGKRNFRSGKTKTSSQGGSLAGDAPMSIPDVEGNSISPGSVDPDKAAAPRSRAVDMKLDSQMQEEDEQIQILDQNGDGILG